MTLIQPFCSSDYGITRPYAGHFLCGTPPEDDDQDDWRWDREKQCLNERIYHSVEALAKQDINQGVIFLKQIAKFSHLFDFETNFENSHDNDPIHDEWTHKIQAFVAENDIQLVHKHVLLIRDPLSVLGSWMGKSGDVHQNNPHPEEVGIIQLLDVYSKVMGATFKNTDDGAVVIDSDDLASQPVKMLQDLCTSLNIEYRDSMLRWKSGKHECDGPWAKWWYHDVWESNGWDAAIEDKSNSGSSGVNHPRTKKYKTVPAELMPVLRMSYPAYSFLKTCTLSYKERNISTPPSGRLYEDPRNEHVLVYVGSSSGAGGGKIIPREMASVSPFDSSVQGGDGKCTTP
jgi:hypothetical protein